MAMSDSEVGARRREYWQELPGRWQAGGPSQAAFCRRRGIPVWKSAWWKKRLQQASPPGVPTGRWRGDGRGRAAGALFVPVRLGANPLEPVAPAAGSSAQLELRLPGGRVLRFGVDVEPARLAGIVVALEALPS